MNLARTIWILTGWAMITWLKTASSFAIESTIVTIEDDEVWALVVIPAYCRPASPPTKEAWQVSAKIPHFISTLGWFESHKTGDVPLPCGTGNVWFRILIGKKTIHLTIMFTPCVQCFYQKKGEKCFIDLGVLFLPCSTCMFYLSIYHISLYIYIYNYIYIHMHQICPPPAGEARKF